MEENYNSKVYIKVDEDGKVLAIDGGYSIGNITDGARLILSSDL